MGSLSRLVGLSALTVFRDSLTYPRPPVLQALAGSLGALSALSSLNLSGNLLGQAGVFALAPVLPLLARSLRHLCLSDAGFGAEGITALAATMVGLTALQALELDGCSSVSALTPCLFQLTSLTLLSLDHGQVNEVGMASLLPCLARLTALQHLGLGECQLGNVGTSSLLTSLVAILGTLVSLTRLEMRCNHLLDSGAEALAGSLSHLTAMRHLDVATNGITETGFDALAPALMRMPALRCLDLSENGFGDAGAVALIPHLHHCSDLEQLKLRNCKVGTAGANVLSGLLNLHLRSLQLLTLRDCLGSVGVSSLAEALCGLLSLRHFELSSSVCDATFPDGPDAARALAAALAGLTGLTRLELRHNEGFSEVGAIAFADSLRSLSRLQYLDYSSCCAEGGGMAALCRSLRGLPRLQHLNLSNSQKAPHNQMGGCSEIASALGPALSSLTALTLLDLSYNDLDVGVAAAMAPGIRGLSRLCELSFQHNCFADGGIALLGDSLKVQHA